MDAEEEFIGAAEYFMEAAEKLEIISITAIFEFKIVIEGEDCCKNQEIHSEILT